MNPEKKKKYARHFMAHEIFLIEQMPKKDYPYSMVRKYAKKTQIPRTDLLAYFCNPSSLGTEKEAEIAFRIIPHYINENKISHEHFVKKLTHLNEEKKLRMGQEDKEEFSNTFYG